MTDSPLAVLLARTAEVRARTHALTEGLSDEALMWQPAPDKWGIAQVLEHLYRTHKIYEPNLRRAIDAAMPAAQPAPLRPGWFARAFKWAIDEQLNIRMPTVPVMEPREATPESPRRFLERWDAFEGLLREAQGRDPRQRVSLAVPVLTLRLGEVFPVLVGHAQRHLLQAERVAKAPGFPT